MCFESYQLSQSRLGSVWWTNEWLIWKTIYTTQPSSCCISWGWNTRIDDTQSSHVESACCQHCLLKSLVNKSRTHTKTIICHSDWSHTFLVNYGQNIEIPSFEAKSLGTHVTSHLWMISTQEICLYSLWGGKVKTLNALSCKSSGCWYWEW